MSASPETGAGKPSDAGHPLLSVIIPVYNEEATVTALLDRIGEQRFAFDLELIIIDDGSTDGSRACIEAWMALETGPGVRRVAFASKENAGKGSAVRVGLAMSRGDVVIIQDADLEYDPADYGALVEPILRGNEKVVYGSRRLGKKKVRTSSRRFYVGGVLVTTVTNVLFGSRLTDVPTCYKVFEGDLIRNLSFEGNRFDWEPEVTAKLLRLGYRIVEFPIAYSPRSVADGKKISYADGLAAIATLLKWRIKPIDRVRHP